MLTTVNRCGYKMFLCYFNILFLFQPCVSRNITADEVFIGNKSIAWESYTFSYSDGEILQYTCNSHTHFIKVSHSKGNYEIAHVSHKKKNSVKLLLTLTKYDDDTDIICYIYENEKTYLNGNYSKTHFVTLNYNYNANKKITYDNELIIPKKDTYNYYQTDIVCIGNGYNKWFRIKDNNIDIEYTHENKKHSNDVFLVLGEQDKDKGFICCNYQIDKSNVYVRSVSNLIFIQDAKEEGSSNKRNRRYNDENWVKISLGGKEETSWKNNSFIYKNSDHLTLKCCNNQKKTIQFIHSKGQYAITKFISEYDKTFSQNPHCLEVSLVMTKFDDHTTISCMVKKKKSSYLFIIDEEGKNGGINYDFDSKMVYASDTGIYKEGQNIVCKGHSYTKWHRVKDEQIDTKYSPSYYNDTELPVKLNLNNATDRQNFFCTSYIMKNGIYVRQVSNMINITLDRPKQELYGNSYSKPPSNVSNYIVGFGVLILAIIVGVLVWKMWPKWSRKRQQSQEVETYVCPSTVQYVDLDLTSRPTGRVAVNDETPYAQIIGVLEPENK